VSHAGERAALQLLLAALLLGVLSGFLAWARPSHNWDMLGYVGASLSGGGVSPEEIHRRAFAIVRENVSDSTWGWLTAGNPYRRTVAADPQAYVQQLPYYSSKPGYVALVHLGSRIGLNPVTATVWLSRAAYLLIGLSLWWWLRGVIGAVSAVPVTMLAMAMPTMLNLAKLSTPDGLSVLLTLNAVLLLVDRSRLLAGCGLLLLSIPIRLDNVLWVGLLAMYLVLEDRRRWRVMAGWVAASGLLVIAIERWSGFYGWRHLLYTNFVERLTYPATEHGAVSIAQYLGILIRQSHPVRLPSYMALFVLLGSLTFWARLQAFGWRNRWTQLMVLCLAFLVLRFLLYPGQERFFVAGYLAILVGVIRTIRELAWSGSHRSSPDSSTGGSGKPANRPE
jgi:hypothetical protein